jgi:bacterioferritin
VNDGPHESGSCLCIGDRGGRVNNGFQRTAETGESRAFGQPVKNLISRDPFQPKSIRDKRSIRSRPLKNLSKDERRQQVIEVLNNARAMELEAISQYMNQHYNLDDMDYGELAAKIKLIGIDEMRHAEMFAERIKELGGEPVAGHDGKIAKGQPVEKIFSYDSALEDDTIDAYNQFALVCRESGDSISMKIFETIIDEEQIHLNYFDNVHSHLDKLGDTYLAKIAGTPSSTGLGASGFAVGGDGE